MKSFNTYYVNKEQLGSFIRTKEIYNSSSLLIQVYSAIVDETFISTLLAELIHFLPDAVIIGATTDGEVMDGKISSGKVILSFNQFKHTTLKAAAAAHKVDGYYNGQSLAKALITDDTKLFIAFTDGLHTKGEEFLKGIASVDDDVMVAGGHAGDNSHFTQTYVFTKDHIFSKGAVGVTLNSKDLQVHTEYSFNWHPIGNELTITKADGNRVYTIDGRSAVETYAYYLGEDIAKGLPGIGVEFPLIVNRNGSNVSRACIAKEEDGSLIVGGDLYTGDKVRIGYGNAKEILQKSHTMFNTTSQKPSECIFIYSCMTRGHFMGEEIETPAMESQLQQMDINTTSIEALIHLINITSEEAQAQAKALQQSYQTNQALKERMELALMGSNDGVWDWNILENSVYFSPRWKEIIGYTDNELPNEVSTWNDRIHPDDAEKAWADVYKNVNGETEYYENVHRLKHKDGHWVWIHDRGKVQFDAQGKAVRMIGTHTDITEQKENELQLLHQAQMIQQTHEAINTTDLQGYINGWNKGSELLFGYKAEEVLGEHISKLFPDDAYETFVKHIPELMKKEEYRSTLTLLKKSDQKVLIDLSLSLLKDNNGSNIGIVGYMRDITEHKKTEEALQYQAHHDALTGLPNRVLFMDRLEQGINKAKRHKEGLAVFFIDLDKFKHINDSLGHSVGDKVLKIIAERLEGIIRKEDTLARLSGDEFTMIMEDLRDPEDASLLGEKILKTLGEAIVMNEQRLYVSGSIGISFYPQDATDAQSLLKYADTAMYRAKEEGRNNFQFYAPEMTELALQRIQMQTSLRQAIDNEEFIIYYQPQIKASTNALIGVEVLIRWDHPTLGILMPDEFIPLAEESGMIAEIDHWVMKTAMKQISQWYKKGLTPGILGLNISIMQLDKVNFIQQIKASLRSNDFDPTWLELEITESQMMKKPEEVITKLHQINALGIGISIDDFGTGYSSLSLLKRLPINRLKIDRSFVRDIPNDDEDVAIVTAIIALAKSLKLDFIAEGVETSEQKEFLIDHGCTNFQGHYFSHPLTAEELHTMLLTYRE